MPDTPKEVAVHVHEVLDTAFAEVCTFPHVAAMAVPAGPGEDANLALQVGTGTHCNDQLACLTAIVGLCLTRVREIAAHHGELEMDVVDSVIEKAVEFACKAT